MSLPVPWARRIGAPPGRRRLVVLALWTVVLALLAGCSNAGQPATIEPLQAPASAWESDEDLVTADLGGIRGSVVDASMLPLANVTVVLEPSDGGDESLGAVLTTPEGVFVFGRIEPNTYRLRATVEGFAETFTFIDVVAAAVATIELVLSEVPTDEPYLEVVVFSGISQCAEWGGVLGSFGIGPTLCPLGGTENRWLNVSSTWRYGVWENNWADKNSNMGLVVRSGSNVGCTAENCHGTKQGSPPIRLDAEPGKVTMPNRSAGWAPYPEGAFNMSLLASYNGRYAREFNQTLGPAGVCPSDGCAGVGPALGVRFDLYASVFHNLAPSHPQLYSALPDE